MMKQGFSVILSGLLVVVVISVSLLAVALTITVLGHVLAYVSNSLFQEYSITPFQYILVMLVIACTAGLAIPLALWARSNQRFVESFSLLQLDEEEEELDDEDALEGDEVEMLDDDEEFNDFLRKLHKSRNIGPFIPSPKTMDDLCPCGSGLKYKDCCGKSWS
jgi:uncharacterized protein YchJ